MRRLLVSACVVVEIKHSCVNLPMPNFTASSPEGCCYLTATATRYTLYDNYFTNHREELKMLNRREKNKKCNLVESVANFEISPLL